MSRWGNCQEQIEKGKNGACSEYFISCANDNGAYEEICKLKDSLTLTEQEHLTIYGKRNYF